MWDLVRNPGDRFSPNEALICVCKQQRRLRTVLLISVFVVGCLAFYIPSFKSLACFFSGCTYWCKSNSLAETSMMFSRDEAHFRVGGYFSSNAQTYSDNKRSTYQSFRLPGQIFRVKRLSGNNKLYNLINLVWRNNYCAVFDL